MALTEHDPYQALRSAEYRWYLLGCAPLFMAAQIQSLVMGWQVYSLTHDPLSLQQRAGRIRVGCGRAPVRLGAQRGSRRVHHLGRGRGHGLAGAGAAQAQSAVMLFLRLAQDRQAQSYLALAAGIRRLVVVPPLQLFGQVVLDDVVTFEVVRVLVLLAIAHRPS